MRARTATIALLVAAALGIAACGDSNKTTSEPAATVPPATETVTTPDVTVQTPPATTTDTATTPATMTPRCAAFRSKRDDTFTDLAGRELDLSFGNGGTFRFRLQCRFRGPQRQ